MCNSEDFDMQKKLKDLEEMIQINKVSIEKILDNKSINKLIEQNKNLKINLDEITKSYIGKKNFNSIRY